MSRFSTWIRSIARSRTTPRTPRALPLAEAGFPVVCCWSAKAGCTTVLKWFLAHVGRLDEAVRHNRWVHAYRQERLCLQPGYEALCRQALASSDVRVIKVVRDPAERAVSAYLHYLRVQPTAWPGAIMLESWKQERGLGGQPGCSFVQFLYFTSDLERTRPSAEPHVGPQFDPDQDSHVDVTIPLEQLAAGLAETEQACGLPHVPIAALSESDHHNRPTAGHSWPSDAARFPATGQTLVDLGVPPARLLLDDTTLPLIATLYACDYRAYARHYRPPR